ncbi:unnamed protein product [Mytilus edulis]|uniref:Endonuclease-reverse transcriptase n=1 Tax=Mytilus edulis TaxID=6550 RepID=A0A8S3QQE5_MYTED|nr:unnamed protein product [Mytilus edulis]
MALNTKSLVEESKKAMEQSDNDSNMNKILMILERIDMRQQKLEDKLSKIDEMSDSLSQICNKITDIETSILNLVKRNSLIEKSVEDIGGLLDTVVERCTSNKKEIENMKRRNTEIERQIENDNLKENFKQIEHSLLDLRCRSMKNNLIFSGLGFQQNENCEEKLRRFMHNELGIEFHVELGNVHRFGKPGLNGTKPIVARFLYRKELEAVLRNTNKLKGKSFGVNEQFPEEIETRRKKLYPVLKKARQEGKQVKLVRDKLFINGKQYQSTEEEQNIASEYRGALLKNNQKQSGASPPIPPRPFKRTRTQSSDTNYEENEYV